MFAAMEDNASISLGVQSEEQIMPHCWRGGFGAISILGHLWSQHNDATNEQECNNVLERVKEKGIFVGEFVKALLKINNIASEIEKVCNITNNMELLKNIVDIPKLTMKYIVSTQSLYL